ncbi:MAG: SHOCT domain-containing protein [Solirubrobacteraceae bacterium]
MRRGIGRRGPGLIGTAVVVGGAAHMGAASAQRSQAAAQQTTAAPQQAAAAPQEAPAAAPAAPAQPDEVAELQKYAALKEQGVITEEEFAAKKKQILGI